MNKYKIPTNFKEYLDCYLPELTVRRLFPRKDMEQDSGKIYKKERIINNYMNISKWEACCISSGYETSVIDKPDRLYTAEKCDAYAQIIATEDNLLFHGDKANYIDGLDKLSTKFNGLLKTAVEKYNPSRIVANRTMLKDIKIDTQLDECQFVEDGTYYLFPEITPDIAEFVIWQDVYEDPVPFKQRGGTNLYDMYEWVAIAIHKPEMFIKVR